MNRTAWMIAAGLALGAAGAASAVELDPKVVAFKLPDQIAWVENARAGNRTAVLQGDPTKSGPYAMLLTWLLGNMSRPHFHPNDRFITVVKGTWWIGTGNKFDPDNSTVPMPAGSFVTHYGKQVHYDGAKDEEAWVLIVGEGPATNTPVEIAK
jgi:hypothetical protein